ncbi:MAG: class I SAM-dependent DNA methyltransferase, partial [Coriobacteriales bacterium]|nr:class I SAM-dependent DNA methyltransferase [Coriobacteriales bacterium]
QRAAASAFAEKWAGRGYEKGDTAPFWLELLRECLGVADPDSIAKFEKRVDTGFPDVTIEDTGVIIEQKSIGIDLDKPEERQKRMVTPYEQALSYAQAQPPSLQPRWIVTSNFKTFRIYDREVDQSGKTFTQIELAELPEQVHLFGFITDPSNSRIERERKVSIEAGALIGDLHRKLAAQYADPESEESQHSLNVLCVRLVFLLFAEDAGLFGARDFFYDYLREIPAGKGQFRRALLDLFDVLDTPIDRRDLYPGDTLAAFPYINGGLFAEKIEVPVFTDDIKFHLLQKTAHDFDWSVISPVVFGGVFESTLNPETRAKGGMHYTSVENIHKVIDPLFLDALEAEFEAIIAAGLPEKATVQKLREFQTKLASLHFLDPAAGSGNFLTETYICLRRLENRVLIRLNAGQATLDFGDGAAVKVSLSQFFGIEINDFACEVARAALWIAELQVNLESEGVIHRPIEDFPLRTSASIACANALTCDWCEILPPEHCDYIMGNPPFLGYSNLSNKQNAEMKEAFEGAPGHNTLDYVSAWYKKAADYSEGTPARCAFVSTNSICQGQQVSPLWKPLFERGIRINFAHQTFVWANEAADMAHVHVVVVGFSYTDRPPVLYSYGKDGAVQHNVEHINAYLVNAADAFIERRAKPLCSVSPMFAGGKPSDGGNLILSAQERDDLIKAEPQVTKWIRPFSMGAEFIKGQNRYCLWLVDCPPSELKAMPRVLERVRKVRGFREASLKAATRRKAETSTLFDEVKPVPGERFIAVPKVSSERRRYIPIGFLSTELIPGDKLFFIPDATLYEFGVLTSQFHNAWTRTVAGRLKSDYSYSNTIVYNNFVWPDATDVQKTEITDLAQAVLDARSSYPESSLADLYDPDLMPPDLLKAHKALDRAVEQAYGVSFSSDEQRMVAHLFKLYAHVAQSKEQEK